MNLVTSIEKSNLRTDLPKISTGDTVRVYQKIKEGEKERVAQFEGMVIAKKHGRGVSATFTVRRVIEGIGVERIFPLHLPTINKIELVSHSRVRRAKLYYIREKAAREIRRKMRTIRIEAEKPTSAPEEKETEKKDE